MALTQERLLQLIERSPDIIVATDRQGAVIYYNDGAAKSLGYSGAEIRGRTVSELYPSLEEARRVMQAMRDGGGQVRTFETEFLAKDGRRVPQDVAVVGFDDLGFAETTDPPLTTVAQPVTQIAERAGEMLQGILSGLQPEPASELFPPRLVRRASA